MKKAMYPGSFDPITFGHLDIITRASKVFDELVIVIMQNPHKVNTFSVEERVKMLNKVTTDLKNVSIQVGDGLTVDFASKIGASVLIRGIRAVMDYEYELQQATANMILSSQIETIFLVSRPKYSFLSSSVAKEVGVNHGDLSAFIPEVIMAEVKAGLIKN